MGAAAFALEETELAKVVKKATPNKAAIEAEVKKFSAKMKDMMKTIKKLDAEDKKIAKAFYKKHAMKVKNWMKQRAAMKKKLIKTIKLAKAALKKAGIKKWIKQLRAMDNKLKATVKKDVKAMLKEAKKVQKMRQAIAKRCSPSPVKEAMKAGKAAAKAIFA